MAARDCRWHRGRFLQRLLLNAVEHAALAGGGGRAGPCAAVGCTQRVRFRRRSRRAGRVHYRWTDTHSGFTPLAHAVCGDRLRSRRVDDAGRLPLQDDERPFADRRRRADDVVADTGDNLRRNDRLDHHFGDELRAHHSDAELPTLRTSRPTDSWRTCSAPKAFLLYDMVVRATDNSIGNRQNEPGRGLRRQTVEWRPSYDRRSLYWELAPFCGRFGE